MSQLKLISLVRSGEERLSAGHGHRPPTQLCDALRCVRKGVEQRLGLKRSLPLDDHLLGAPPPRCDAPHTREASTYMQVISQTNAHLIGLWLQLIAAGNSYSSS